MTNSFAVKVKLKGTKPSKVLVCDWNNEDVTKKFAGRPVK